MKLNNIKSVNEVKKGVSVHLGGDIEVDKVKAMVAKCGTGTCSCCGPEFVQALDGIDVDGKDGNVTMTIKGPVSKEIISEKLAICDCYNT